MFCNLTELINGKVVEPKTEAQKVAEACPAPEPKTTKKKRC